MKRPPNETLQPTSRAQRRSKFAAVARAAASMEVQMIDLRVNFFCALLFTLAAHFTALPTPVYAVNFGYFVRFHGIRYIGDRFQEGRLVTPDDLGPEFGRVTCNIVDLYSSASDSMAPSPESAARMRRCEQQEGGGSSLPLGTPVHRIRDYRSDYRLAAFTGYQWMISTRAKMIELKWVQTFWTLKQRWTLSRLRLTTILHRITRQV